MFFICLFHLTLSDIKAADVHRQSYTDRRKQTDRRTDGQTFEAGRQNEDRNIKRDDQPTNRQSKRPTDRQTDRQRDTNTQTETKPDGEKSNQRTSALGGLDPPFGKQIRLSGTLVFCWFLGSGALSSDSLPFGHLRPHHFRARGLPQIPQSRTVGQN